MRLATIVAVALLTTGGLTAAERAHASITHYELNIPRQPLDTALEDLAQQTRLQVGRFSDAVKGDTVVGPVTGNYSADQALETLLAPTRLTYRTLNDRAIIVLRPEDVAQLPAAKTLSDNSPLEVTGEGQGVRNSGKGGEDASAASEHTSFWSRLRLAQSGNQTASSVNNAPSSYSQQGPATSSRGSSESAQLEQVIVTAQKREQNLQDIPISISAISGGRIKDLGLWNLKDLMGQVPGVDADNMVIRGIATGSVADNRSGVVGVYINDTAIGLPNYTPDISPFDLERVEVLRGPQGTLYGSGSLAGTIRYITGKPDTHKYQAELGVDASTTRRGGFNHRVDALVNIPLADTLALRAVGYEAFDDGYIRGVGPANSGRDANNAKQYGGRAALRWQVTPDFTADANVLIQRTHSDLTSADNIGYVYSHGVPVGPYEQYRYTPSFDDNNLNLYSLSLEYALGWGKLLSSTSYLQHDFDTAQDFNGTMQLFYGVDLPARAFIFSKRNVLSEELRLATDLAGPLNFVGGVFYTDWNLGQYFTNPVPGFDAAYTIPRFGVDSTAFGAAVDETFTGTSKTAERQTALFGELTYAMTSKLSATVGLRWFDVTQNYFLSTGGVVANGNPPLTRVYAEHGFNPKFLVSYKVSDDTLLSAQVARGFRLGGPNDLVPQALCAADLAALGLTKAPESVGSEHVWNYELDAKTSWDDRRVIVNGSVYYIDYKNIQVQTNLQCSFNFDENAAAATSKGVELELTAKPLRALEVTLGGAYTDATLSVDVPPLAGKAGDQLPLSAKFTANATARYDFPIRATLQGFVQYIYRYTGRTIMGLGYEGNAATRAQPVPAYQLHNIRMGLADHGWEASLYLNNALDAEVITANIVGFGEYTRSLGQPRTAGLSVYYNW